MVLFAIRTLLPLSIPYKPTNVSDVPSPSNPQPKNAAKFFFNSNVFTRAYLTMFYKPTLFYYMDSYKNYKPGFISLSAFDHSSVFHDKATVKSISL